MRDFCFKTTNEANLIAAFAALGLTKPDENNHPRIVGDFLFVASPAQAGEMSATESTEGSANGSMTQFAIFRASDTQAAIIAAATLPDGVKLVPPPEGIPLFGGEWLESDIPALQQQKTAACRRIDAMAEALRQTVITPGAGQMAAYQIKEIQARALLQDPTPSEDTYPDIFNEVGITAETAHDVAMAVLAAAEKWHLFNRAIEKVRLTGKQAVSAASDVAEIAEAEAGIAWPQAE